MPFTMPNMNKNMKGIIKKIKEKGFFLSLLACFARFTAFPAIFSASISNSLINSWLASSLTRSAPAFLISRVTGAIGSSLIFIIIIRR